MELGILFDIDDLGGGFYGFEAWKIFLKHCNPEKLSGCMFYEGDTIDTLEGRANTFCIAVQSSDPTAVNYLKQTFAGLKEKGLLPPNERFVEGTVTSMHPLVLKAQVDTGGRFVTESWTEVDEELCEASGWQYAPRKPKSVVVGEPTSVAVPSHLSAPLSGPPPSPPPSLEKEGRRPTGLTWVIVAHAVLSLSILAIVAIILAPSPEETTDSQLIVVAAVLIFLVAALFGVTAWGVAKRKKWARILLIITMVLCWLPSFPIGTVVAIAVIYSLYKNPDWIAYFEQT